MDEKKSKPEKTGNLRKRAEEKARANEARTPERLSPKETRLTLHELQVHQIELEMQNEELRRAQEELEVSRARYFDLYDMAPVGYLTISEKGLILETNITAAGLLGEDRGLLVKQPLTHFIFSEDQDIYYRHRKQLLEANAPQECDLRMMKKDGVLFWAHMACAIFDSADKESVSKVILSDITDRIQLEQVKEKLIAELQKAITEIKTLTGIIPICASCKKIRNDKGSWDALEKYFMDHSDVLFSHGLCDDCIQKYYPEQYDNIHKGRNKNKDA